MGNVSIEYGKISESRRCGGGCYQTGYGQGIAGCAADLDQHSDRRRRQRGKCVVGKVARVAPHNDREGRYYDWRGAARAAMGSLGWSPQIFWTATPCDLKLALSRDEPRTEQGDALTGAELRALRAAFPDSEIHSDILGK